LGDILKPISVVCYHALADFPLMFYAQQTSVSTLWNKDDFKKVLDQKKVLLVYASTDAIKELDENRIAYRIIEQREQHLVARLSLQFLNPATRASACDKVYLLEAKVP
jgi:hypothetical protein